MTSFSRLICFESDSDGQTYFADLGADIYKPPTKGSSISAYRSFEDLLKGGPKISSVVGKVTTSKSSIV